LAWRLSMCPFEKLRDAGRAVALAQQAITQVPANGDYRLYLALAYYRAGRCQDGLKTLKHAQKPPISDLIRVLCLGQVGEDAEARDCFERALRRSGAATARPCVYEQQLRAEAERLLTRGVDP